MEAAVVEAGEAARARARFTLLAGEAASKVIFLDGVETTWARVSGWRRGAKLADVAVAKFDLQGSRGERSRPAGDPQASRLRFPPSTSIATEKSAASSTGRSRAASVSWSRRRFPRPKSYRTRCYTCGTRPRSARACPSAGWQCRIPSRAG